MIQARHLRRRFGPVEAVKDISFTAADACISGPLGENGAGKTTTLPLTCGLVVPDAGTVEVGGDPGGDHRRRLGALLDHKGLYERLTARENIAYFGRLHGLAVGGESEFHEPVETTSYPTVETRFDTGRSRGTCQ
jgi:sodium transport system ATP-binding protein